MVTDRGEKQAKKGAGGNGRKKIRKADRGKPARIVVERVYLGGQSMEDVFRKINEETVKENITEILGKTV